VVLFLMDTRLSGSSDPGEPDDPANPPSQLGKADRPGRPGRPGQPGRDAVRHFMVVGESRALVAQVLLALHSFTPSRCMVVCGAGSRILRLSRLCAEHVELNFYGPDDERFTILVNHAARTHDGLMLVPADCQGTRLINRVRRRLRAAISAAPETAVLDLLDNKWHFYQFCRNHHLNVPETRYFPSKHEIDFGLTARALGLPFVVKPLAEAASAGVRVIADAVTFRQTILDDPHYRHAPLIAQRYIDGIDVGLNLLAIDGRLQALAVQRREASKVHFFANDYLENCAEILAAHARYHGVMNVDARIDTDSGRVYLFESNPRAWRSLAASVWCGVNFIGASLDPGAPGKAIATAPVRLTSGTADLYYHPVLRPSLWRHVLHHDRQGRMARIMLADPYLFLSSMRPALTSVWQALNWHLLRRRIARVY
jgi:hypothetical protein